MNPTINSADDHRRMVKRMKYFENHKDEFLLVGYFEGVPDEQVMQLEPDFVVTKELKGRPQFYFYKRLTFGTEFDSI